METFIRGLVNEEVYDTSEQDKLDDLEKVRTGTFSPILLKAFPLAKDKLPEVETQIRKLAEAIVEEKGYFSLHADEKSNLMFDLIFYLYSSYNTARSFKYYMNDPKVFETSYDNPSYVLMIAFGLVDNNFSFGTGGYSSCFMEDWWKDRVKKGYIIPKGGGFRPSEELETRLVQDLEKY